MRKFGLILIGLLLIAGAVGAFVYRLDENPFAANKSGPTAASRSIGTEPANEPKAEGLEAFARQRYYEPQTGGWQLFSMVMDVLNLIVGGVGIMLTFNGIRMRRMDMRQHS